MTLIGWLVYRKFKKSTPIVKSIPENSQSHAGSPGPEEEEYEPQYHPKAEIGDIFGDKKQKYKINNADDVAVEDKHDTHGEEEAQNYT